MNNTDQLTEELAKISNGKLLVVLDEDDILHPEDTINRYRQGIDTNFLVKHFGQGEAAATGEDEYDYDYGKEQSHSEYVSYEDLMRSAEGN